MAFSVGFISMPGGSEWIVIFLVILIIFGPKSLPKIGHAIGRGIREFKDASNGITKAIEEEASALERGTETKREKESSTTDTEASDENSPHDTEPHSD